jgi:hypothetical protein
MGFVERFNLHQKHHRKAEVLRGRLYHLIQDDPTNEKFDAVAKAFDRADARDAASLADLHPWPIVKSTGR